MIEAQVFYLLRCECCAVTSTDGTEHAAWAEVGQARQHAGDSDWHLLDDLDVEGTGWQTGDYCPACVTWHDDLDRIVPHDPTQQCVQQAFVWLDTKRARLDTGPTL